MSVGAGVQVYRTRWFSRFARQHDIEDRTLLEAVDRAERGLIDADLGGDVIKQRIARPNEGRSGGFRSIVLFRSGDKAFFVYGFAKNAKENIRADELRAFRLLAVQMLAYDADALNNALRSEAIVEVKYDGN
jgi:hypothetical protein